MSNWRWVRSGSLDEQMGRLTNFLQGLQLRGASYLLTYGLRVPVRTVTTSQAVKGSDHTVRADCAGGAVVLTLPEATEQAGRMLVFVKVGAANTLTVNDAAGAAVCALAGAGNVAWLQCNGATWDRLV